MSVPRNLQMPSQSTGLDSAPVGLPNVGGDPSAARLERALRLWADWNEAYENLTANMFEAAHDQPRVEALAEEVDRLRQRAVAATRRVLG